MEQEPVTHYVAMWCMNGLECIFSVDKHLKEHEEYEKRKIISILKEEPKEPKPQGIPIQMMILRARVNSQRQYEIYEFTSTLSQEELEMQFNENPQIVVDFIREQGYKIYSDYHKDKVLIK